MVKGRVRILENSLVYHFEYSPSLYSWNDSYDEDDGEIAFH